MNDHDDVKRARLLNEALHDISRLLDGIACLYRVAYRYNGMHLGPQIGGYAPISSDAIHVDVRWLGELVADINGIAACVGSNNYVEARRQGSDLAHGIASLGGHRHDAVYESGHSWENARHFVRSVSLHWGSEVIPLITTFVAVLDVLVQKFAALDDLYQPASRSGPAA